MAGYTGAGPGMGANGGVGLGQVAAAQAAPQTYQGVAGPVGQGSPMGTNLPSSVQRMPGGFGLSPQMLQMIASLQSRSPKFTPGQVPNQFGVMPQQRPPTIINNPYAQSQGMSPTSF